MNEDVPVLKNENKNDLISNNRTIYDASSGEIFWKNFLAGFSRGLGGFISFIILWLIIFVIFSNFVLPKIMPSITKYTNIFESLGSINSKKSGQIDIIPENLDFQKLLGK